MGHSEAISERSTRQMPTSLVRIRYLRFAMFLTVSSVITKYTYQGDVGVSGQADITVFAVPAG